MTRPLTLIVISLLLAGTAAAGGAYQFRHGIRRALAPVGAVSWASPADGSTVSGITTLQVTAPDTTTLTTFFVDGRAAGVDASGSPWSIRWDTYSLAKGPHMLSVAARTLGGNLLRSRTITVEVRNLDDPLVAVAADVACDPADPAFNKGIGTPSACRQAATARLLDGRNLAAVFVPGDTQYYYGGLAAYDASYDASWGKYKAITYPAAGNHEYLSGEGAGYYAYFGARAGDAAKGYYSFNLSTWHVIVLNSQCDEVGGCDSGSPQERWLREDLAAHPATCTLAFWHVPRFSSSPRGDNAAMEPFWADLYAAGADIALNGHSHEYERLAPMDPLGNLDPAHGIREFVVGTGGAEHIPFAAIRAHSEARSDNTFGVLLLTLHPKGYDWQFVPEVGETFTDSGSGSCD
jgi:hypothetical protein